MQFPLTFAISCRFYQHSIDNVGENNYMLLQGDGIVGILRTGIILRYYNKPISIALSVSYHTRRKWKLHGLKWSIRNARMLHTWGYQLSSLSLHDIWICTSYVTGSVTQHKRIIKQLIRIQFCEKVATLWRSVMQFFNFRVGFIAGSVIL